MEGVNNENCMGVPRWRVATPETRRLQAPCRRRRCSCWCTGRGAVRAAAWRAASGGCSRSSSRRCPSSPASRWRSSPTCSRTAPAAPAPPAPPRQRTCSHCRQKFNYHREFEINREQNADGNNSGQCREDSSLRDQCSLNPSKMQF